jgi:hypothetical protein
MGRIEIILNNTVQLHQKNISFAYGQIFNRLWLAFKI